MELLKFHKNLVQTCPTRLLMDCTFLRQNKIDFTLENSDFSLNNFHRQKVQLVHTRYEYHLVHDLAENSLYFPCSDLIF